MYLGGTGIGPTSSPASSRRWRSQVRSHDLPLAQARGLVAQHGQERHRLGLDQLGDQPRQVEVGPAAIERGHLQEVGVVRGALGQCGATVSSGATASGRASSGPISSRSSSHVRSARCTWSSHGSRFQRRLYSGRSISAMFGFVSISVDPPLDERPVRLGPVRRDLGDRRRAVPLEPGGLAARRPPSCGPSRSRRRARPSSSPEDRRTAGHRPVRDRLHQPVEPVALPVQLLLQARPCWPESSPVSRGLARSTLGRRHLAA